LPFNWLKRLFGPTTAKDPRSHLDNLPEIPWLAPEHNLWDVPVLDVRPVTANLLSFTSTTRQAKNAGSFIDDDGSKFIGVVPPDDFSAPLSLTYKTDGYFAEGALFTPHAMEQKWAIYHYGGKIIFIRSWLREVVAIADIELSGHTITLTRINGGIADIPYDPAYINRFIDYLIRTHCMEIPYPAPLPEGFDEHPKLAAMWCMHAFGRYAPIATVHPLAESCPTPPLRPTSLLHIAVSRSNINAAQKQLDRGMPIDLLAQNGFAPLHWSLQAPGTIMTQFLLDRGSNPNVRSDTGITPLMSAVAGKRLDSAQLLLDRAADPNAATPNGTTALHLAAESAPIDIVQLLLAKGASPHATTSEGRTPLSIAQSHGDRKVQNLFTPL